MLAAAAAVWKGKIVGALKNRCVLLCVRRLFVAPRHPHSYLPRERKMRPKQAIE